MIKPQSFLGRVTTFVMSVLLVSTFFFPFISQPALANEATSATIQNFETPICTAESRGLFGKSECNLTVNNNNTSPKDLAGAAIAASVATKVFSSNTGSVAGLKAAGSKTMRVLSRGSVKAAAAAGAVGSVLPAYQGIQGLSSDHEQTTEQTHE